MSSVIKSSIQSRPSKVEIVTVPITQRASVTAQQPKGFVVVERDSETRLGHNDDKYKKVKPIRLPGCPLPQVIPEDLEQIETKVKNQKKENLKQPKKNTKNVSNNQNKVTQDDILTLKGIIKDYQKVYKPENYLSSNSSSKKTQQRIDQREMYKYPPGSNCLAFENITTPREYSCSPSLSTDSEDITSTDTFNELMEGRTYSSRKYKNILSDVTDSESEITPRNDFSHNASDKENIFNYYRMPNKIKNNKDDDRSSCIMTKDDIDPLLSPSKRNPTQSSVKKIVTFADPSNMQSINNETNTGIVPVKQGYLRVRERPHSSTLADRNRYKKINSHSYRSIVNPTSRLTQTKTSGICNRAVKMGFLGNEQGITKNKASSTSYNSSQQKTAQEKKKQLSEKEMETRRLSNHKTKFEVDTKNLDFVNDNLAYLLKLEKQSSDIDDREQRIIETRELEKAISLASEIRGKLQEHSSEAPSDLSALISDLRSGSFDEDKYIISKRVDKYIRKTSEQAINEVREGRISSPVETWSENRQAMWSNDNFERVPPTHPLPTQRPISTSHPSSVGKLQDKVPPLFYSPKRSRKIEINKNDHIDKRCSYDHKKIVPEKDRDRKKNMGNQPITSKAGLKFPQEFSEENESNKRFQETYTVRPIALQISNQPKLHIPASRVIQKLPGVSISPRNYQGSHSTNRNKIFNVKHNGNYSENSDLEDRDLNENQCSICCTSVITRGDCKCNKDNMDFRDISKPKKQNRNTHTVQEQSMTHDEDIEEIENSEYDVNKENKVHKELDSNHLIHDIDESHKIKKVALGRLEDNVEDNELPGYFPEVIWEEVQIPDPPPVEGSAEEVEELEQKLQEHQFQHRLLNRLEEGLRQLFLREVQLNSQERDVRSPSVPPTPKAIVLHDDHVQQEQTMSAARSVLEKLVREQLTLRRKQRQQNAADNPDSLHEEEEVPDEDFQSTDVSTATSYTTPGSPSNVSALSASEHGLEIHTPSVSPPASPKRHEVPPCPILTPEPSLDTFEVTTNSFSSSPSPSPTPSSLPKTHTTNLPDVPEYTPMFIPNQSPKLKNRNHSSHVPSPHQSQPHSPYLTPYQSPHITPHSSPSHHSIKPSASDIPSSVNSSSGSSINHIGELTIQSHGRVNTPPPSTPCIHPKSDRTQDIPHKLTPTSAPKVQEVATTFSIDSESQDIPQTPPSTPAPQVLTIETTLPIDSEAQNVPRTPPSTPAPQVPEIATTISINSENPQHKEKESNTVFVSEEDGHIKPYGETWTEDADQVSRASDSRETWSPLIPAVVCYSSGNATAISTETSDKTWVTMSEGEILQGAVDNSLFEEGELLHHIKSNQGSKTRNLSLNQKQAANRSISVESLGLLETISEGLLLEDLAEDSAVEESLIEESLIAASVSSKALSLEDLIEDSLAEEGSVHGDISYKSLSEGVDNNSFCLSEGMLFCDDNISKEYSSDVNKTNVTTGDAEGCESVVQDSTYSLGEALPTLHHHKLQQDKTEPKSTLHQANPELTQLHQENNALLARLENYRKFAFLSKSTSVGSARARSKK